MGRRDKEVLDKVAILCCRSKAPLSASSLTCVGGDGCAFDVTTVGDSNGHIFVSNQIFDGEFDAFVNDLCTSFITKVAF